MDLRGFVPVFEPGRHESVGAYDTVHKVGASLYHTLVDQLAERLILAHIAKVVEELVPEPGIDKVSGSVFGTAHIQIDGAPVFICTARHQRRVVLRIHIAQIICARSGKAGHGGRLERPALVGPVLGARKRSLAGRLIRTDFRQSERQVLLGNRARNTVLVVDGERLPPITLT